MMTPINFIFLGATTFSQAILLSLIEQGYVPKAVFTIPEQFDISYAKGSKVKNYNYARLEDICETHGIPVYSVESGNNTLPDYEEMIQALDLDMILVMGWYYMVPKSIRNRAKFGAWGIHASLLPDYAGGAPLVWAMIHGERETGVTLFRLDEGVDDGDVIAQRRITIEEEDTIKEVYAKATIASSEMLLDVLSRFPTLLFTPQDRQHLKLYPQRCPQDGELDLTRSSRELYNFIRAQSSPYPGAFIRTVDGKKLVIEKARIQEEV